MDPYVLQGVMERQVLLPVCRSLRVEDLRRHNRDATLRCLERTEVVVFVAGDVAQAKSASDLKDGSIKPRFLFVKSKFEKIEKTQNQPSEMNAQFSMLFFSSWIAKFNKGNLCQIVPIPGGVVIFPRVWKEDKAQQIGQYLCNTLNKCARAAVWSIDDTIFINEYRLAKKDKKTCI